MRSSLHPGLHGARSWSPGEGTGEGYGNSGSRLDGLRLTRLPRARRDWHVALVSVFGMVFIAGRTLFERQPAATVDLHFPLPRQARRFRLVAERFSWQGIGDGRRAHVARVHQRGRTAVLLGLHGHPRSLVLLALLALSVGPPV